MIYRVWTIDKEGREDEWRLSLDADTLAATEKVLAEWESAQIVDSWSVERINPVALYFSEWMQVVAERVNSYDDWLSGQEDAYSDAGSAFVSERNL